MSLDLLGPSHGLLKMTSAYCLLHWISRVQVVDSSPLRLMKNWPLVCLSLVFYRCQQVRPHSGQLGILSFLECQHYETDAKTQHAPTQALNDDDLSRVINCTSAYEV